MVRRASTSSPPEPNVSGIGLLLVVGRPGLNNQSIQPVEVDHLRIAWVVLNVIRPYLTRFSGEVPRQLNDLYMNLADAGRISERRKLEEHLFSVGI